MGQQVFSVIDVETTGLYARRHDRITEIALVTVDRDGTIGERWETLVNPDRDLGATRLHGTCAADVLEAPRFEEIADEVAWRLSGTVPVAHNLAFDAAFLTTEFQRAGRPPHPTYFSDGLCTMRLSSRYLPSPSRRLGALCDQMGIRIDHAHCAGDDAQATAELLSTFISSEPSRAFFDMPFRAPAVTEWSVNEPATHPACRHRGAAPEEHVHFLARMVQRLPGDIVFGGEAEYLDLLDRALLDRHLSAHEEQALVELARECDVDRTRAESLHRTYVSQLAAAAMRDGELSVEERQDLRTVADLLAVPQEVLDAIVQRVSHSDEGGRRS
ncbi:3'-5' exonuclease [Schaalia sp. 19OD2882]|uniref:3'-5' exonuclease n=1 Tax=Schaalia sp. 19OD2882 TaxID=2794089 RepID=UPI001C1EE07B|nr:3'-5' exonuclease [Schaalia sp. 19OD2882]QWW19377.1 3'-5' exonuclease [Schaalia sp. 19OD2882]